MREIINRLKSPVVIMQIVSILGALVMALVPEKNDIIEKIVYSITAIINLLAGLNNPTDKENF